jgi:hypothetical protein
LDADRALLGLPTDRPVVMSGHQPTLWHAGILAKLLATAELARATGAAAAWIVPDMDEADPTRARLPEGRGVSVTARSVRVLAGESPGPGVPAGALGTREPADAGLPGLREALGVFRDEPSMAAQVGKGVVRLACERFGLPEITVFTATDLTRTRVWAALLDAIARDPDGCVRAYNAAARAHPGAGVRELSDDRGRVELPLWRVRPDLPRLPVFADQLAGIPRGEIRPRALAMTAVVRGALCDFFVHGTGGEQYDRVTGAWLEGWDRAPCRALAPTGVATADAFPDLGLDPDDLPDPAGTRWRAHHARHDPAMLGDGAAAEAKQVILSEIDAAKDAGQDPAPHFARLQSLLTEARARHADRLAQFDAEAERADRLAGVRELALDRAWPWPVLGEATLQALHRAIRSALGAATMPVCSPSPPFPPVSCGSA